MLNYNDFNTWGSLCSCYLLHMSPYKNDCFLLLHPPVSSAQSSIAQLPGGEEFKKETWSSPVIWERAFFLESIAALNNFFWQLHFHPVYFLFIRANVLEQSWMSCGFGQRGHHPQLGYATDHVRNCSPLQNKVSWPNLSHTPLQSKHSQLLCTEIKKSLWNGPLFGSSVGAIIPDEKIVSGNFWTEEFVS